MGPVWVGFRPIGAKSSQRRKTSVSGDAMDLCTFLT